MNIRETINSNLEQERHPRYRFMITRHAERLPSGELSPEGIEHAKRKGEIMKDAEVLKAYASDHSSGRAFTTGDLISKESGILSGYTSEQYKTRKVKDIQYDILKPDMYEIIPNLKILIEEPTIQEALRDDEIKKDIKDALQENPKILCKKDSKGEPMIDIEKLPVAVQMKIAPIRQKYQKEGFRACLADYPEAAHRMAMGLSHQLMHEMGIATRYSYMRDKNNTPPEKDVVLNTATHGLFVESLLQEAGIQKTNTSEEIHGIRDFESENFGGYIQPAEAIYLDVDDPMHIPERIPVVFEGEHRPALGQVFIDKKKLEELDRDYREWVKSKSNTKD